MNKGRLGKEGEEYGIKYAKRLEILKSMWGSDESKEVFQYLTTYQYDESGPIMRCLKKEWRALKADMLQFIFTKYENTWRERKEFVNWKYFCDELVARACLKAHLYAKKNRCTCTTIQHGITNQDKLDKLK